jgi:hypothetical protein
MQRKQVETQVLLACRCVRRRFIGVAILGASIGAITGCEKKGIERFDLAGQVTFGGQPVPRGYMIFTPDREKGNSGPAAKSEIRNGQYETIKGLGVIGGPHVVSIVGTDGVPYDQGGGVMNPMGRQLFPEYKATVDLPKESGTFDFAVPSQ